MGKIFETENFEVVAPPKPLVDRDEGGHVKIATSKGVKDRLELEASVALEFAWLTHLVGEAFKNTMIKQGVKIIKLNYQDMGNWYYKTGTAEFAHIHIFGRVLGAKHQPFPESVHLPDRATGFYDSFKPLTQEDESLIAKEINRLLLTEKYKRENWLRG